MSDGHVFISYGRADGETFAIRLAADLRAAGWGVWIDRDRIPGGVAFDTALEDGIRRSVALAAVLTPRSLEDDSVCRNEILFAVREGKRVVPLRIDPSPSVRPSLLLIRSQWVDFTGAYDVGLQSLLACLAAPRTEERSPIVDGVQPLDFSVEIARHAATFVGREWLSEAVDRWISSAESKLLLLVSDPGFGKTAFLANLAVRQPAVVAAHFCSRALSRSVDPHAFVASCVAQLSARLPGCESAIAGRAPSARRPTAVDALRELVVEPLRSLPRQPAPCILLVDGLDEAARTDGEDVVGLVDALAEDAPDWLRIVATSRAQPEVSSRLGHGLTLPLGARSAENHRDVERYVASRLSQVPAAAGDRGARSSRVVIEESGGLFLFAKYLLDESDPGPAAGGCGVARRTGVEAFYAREFRRRFPDVAAYRRDVAPVLACVTAAAAPLPFDLLRDALALESAALHERLLQIGPLLRPLGAPDAAAYAPFHASLAEWVGRREAAGSYWCAPETGHRALAEALLRDAAGARRFDGYALESLSRHLLEAGLAPRVPEVVDAAFLCRKLRAAGYAALDDVENLARALLSSARPDAVARCVAAVEALRGEAGGDAVRLARGAVLGRSPSADTRRSPVVPVRVPRREDVDLWSGMIPAGDIGADFVEVVAGSHGLSVVLGDAPGSGLSGAFTARFASAVLRDRLRSDAADLPGAVERLERLMARDPFFTTVSLVAIRYLPSERIVEMLSAGGPPPAVWRPARGAWDVLPIHGPMVNARADSDRFDRRLRRTRLDEGDLVVLCSDGLTEAHCLDGSGYGDRYLSLVPGPDHATSEALGRCILDDWLGQPRDASRQDDVTIVTLRGAPRGAPS